MLHRLVLAALAFAALAAASVPAAADRVLVGTLDCRSPGTISIIVSYNTYRCTFRSISGRTYRYDATVGRIGYDFGLTVNEVLKWHVHASTSRINRNTLRGRYVGGHAGIGIVIGLGANALVGGNHNTVSLQPISVEATTGVNIALSVAMLTLH
jgi:hypothetical protein